MNMEIPQDRSFRKKIMLPLAVGLIGGLILFAGWLTFDALGQSIPAVQATKEVVVQARRGTFVKSVVGYGRLVPRHRRSLVSRVDGSVVEILIRPGMPVKADTPVIRLVNPRLQRNYDDAVLQLKEAQANFTKLEADLTDEKLQLENEKRLASAYLKTQQVEFEATKKLAERHIVSQIELEKKRSTLEQAALRLQLARQRLQTFKKLFRARIHAEKLRLERAERLQRLAKEDLDSLIIRAGMNGVLQTLDPGLELGSWVAQGKSIGVVADLSHWQAEVMVSATEAPEIRPGMPVELDVKGHLARGEVFRVAPQVVRNQVQVDIMVTSQLPDTGRADVEVGARIQIQKLENALILPRPSNFKPGERLTLWVRNNEQLVRRDVRVLAWSSKEIAIGSGLTESEVVVFNVPLQSIES
ncbi:MAG: HlyD family efflux transporter periplasmic adaptor subunit [Gammaproteobacteria bacterium]|nr:MAG: HlyD family efflux transporter periplasmic adaptor subunit [Gammaproteobacteria bacterium]